MVPANTNFSNPPNYAQFKCYLFDPPSSMTTDSTLYATFGAMSAKQTIGWKDTVGRTLEKAKLTLNTIEEFLEDWASGPVVLDDATKKKITDKTT
jgi:hypothetical protein